MRRPYFRREVNQKLTRYNYPIKTFSGFDAETKEDSLPLNYATYGYNIAMRNGILTDAVGIEHGNHDGLVFPNTTPDRLPIDRLYHFKFFSQHYGVKNDRVVAYRDKKAYECELSNNKFTEITGMEFDTVGVKFLNFYAQDSDMLVAISDQGGLKTYNGIKVEHVTSSPALDDACVHFGRIFGVAARSNKVFFSALYDPTNWNVGLQEGGYIALTDDGGLLKRIISFKDNLYIFREYAIYKISAFADQTDFSVSKVYTGNNKVCPDTVTVCNDRIIFLADDGFYSFDGYNIKKILRNIFPLIDDYAYASACYFNHKFFLTVKMVVDDNEVGDETYHYTMRNNALFIYDIGTGETGIFRGGDVGGFMPISTAKFNKLFVWFNNYIRSSDIGVITDTGRFFNKKLHKKWVSPSTNFETLSKDKVLKKLYISSTAPLTLTARLETDVKYLLDASYKAQMVPINKRADKIGLALETDQDNFAVTGMLLEFDLIRRRTDE